MGKLRTKPVVSEETWKKLNGLSEKQLRNLADMIGVGFLDEVTKDEIISSLKSEPESKIIAGFKKLKL